MPIKLNGATNGSVELDVPAAVGSDLQITLPATAGEAIVKAADGSVDLGSVDIDSSGNVGIGTSSPTNGKLEVTHSSSTIPAGFFRNTSGSGDSPSLTVQGGANNAAPNFSVLDYNGNTDFVVQGTGNVGIGTTTPAGKLTLKTTNSNGAPSAWDASYFVISEGDTNTSFGLGLSLDTTNNEAHISSLIPGSQWEPINYRASQHKFFVTDAASNEVMRIDSSGRLMLGRTSATHRLSLTGTANDKSAELQLTASSVASGYIGPNANGLNIGTDTAGIVFKTGVTGGGSVGATGTERMRIDSSGNVGIGTTVTNWFSGSDKLVVRNSSNTGSSSCVLALQDAGGQYPFVAWNSATTGTRGLILFRTGGAGGVIGSITTNGSTTTYSTSSDYRLKENVVDIADGITRVKQLQPKRFNFIADADTTVDGFLAHEAQTVVPEAVTGEKDSEEMQGIDQSKLVPLLTAALQEAIAKIETLENKVAALEAI